MLSNFLLCHSIACTHSYGTFSPEGGPYESPLQRFEINHLKRKLFKILAYFNNTNNIHDCYILCFFCAPITMLSVFYLMCIVGLNIPVGRCYYFHFTNDKLRFSEIKHLAQDHTISN